MSGLTKEQINELKNGFKIFDQDGSGSIDPQEIRSIMANFDSSISENDIDELIDDLDKNNDGMVDFNEFANQLGKKFYSQPPRAELEAAFKYFEWVNKDGSGFIDEEELIQVIRQFNPKYSEERIKKVISTIDKDNSGKICIDEFVQMMTQ
ncbi:calmodulin [Brachionus plicatilis]|uniref:Calmodulin n=1 Tax=Brachionus plicatilis TaxID=10195 RepID=A0A3M7SQA1_BRAPC|nr:calmodulin [Brachionus plicatilis]